MVYVTVKEETDQKLHLSREPSNTSWALLIGFCAFGVGAAYYGNDHIVWKTVYISLGVLVGISCLEDWEECEFNKETGELRLKRHSAWDLILSPFSGRDNVIVANLPDVIGVRVAEEKVNYFGNTHQVVLVMSTGMSLGITESFTFGTTKDHYQIADKIRDFLGLDNVKDPLQWDVTNEEPSSSNDEDTADDFEQIDKSELLDETIDNTESLPKDKDTDQKDP